MFFILREANGARSRARRIHQAGGARLRGLLNSASEIENTSAVKRSSARPICGIVAGLWLMALKLDYPILCGA